MVAVLMPVFASPDRPIEGGFYADRLRAALARGSLVELEEIGTNLPEGDLLAAIESPDRALCLAGIAAAPSALDAWLSLPALAERAASADRPIAAAAAESATTIARELSAAMVAEADIAGDELEPIADAWLALAEHPAYWPDVRVRGLEISVSLGRARGLEAPVYDLEALAADAEPEIRRAAYELLPGSPPLSARAIAARAVVEDRESEVALAAAQALCSALEPRPGPRAPPAEPVLRALGPDGLLRIAELVADDRLAPGGILAAARCLAADGSPESRGALAALEAKGARVIRAHVRALIEAMAP